LGVEEKNLEEEGGHVYTKEELEALSATTIQGFIKKLKLRGGKTKADKIEKILAWQRIPEDLTKSTMKTLQESIQPGESPIHKFYGGSFNPVDLADGYYYAIAPKHFVKQWQAKFVMILLSIGLINVHALYKYHKRTATVNQTTKLFVEHILFDNYKLV